MNHSVTIRSQDCIGCTKCLDVCPTDAIIGAPELLHSVITEDCIGCERCVPACPTDCIELITMPGIYDPQKLAEPLKFERVAYIRELAQAHKARIEQLKTQEQQAFLGASAARRAYLDSLFKK